MGRPKRDDQAGSIYHMLNRANRREVLAILLGVGQVGGDAVLLASDLARYEGLGELDVGRLLSTTGASFTGSTLSVTVARLEVASPSSPL